MARCLTVLDSTEAVRSPAGAENTSGPGRSMKEIDVAKRSCAVGYTQCAQCGNLFTHPVRKHHPRTYCSRSCRAKANMTAERARAMLAVRADGWTIADAPLLARSCEPCGETFTPTSHRQLRCTTCVPDSVADKRFRRYGVTEPQWQEMVRRHDGACWLCRDEAATDVEHCHTTGALRGVVCNNCNVCIGALERGYRSPRFERLGLMDAALNYIAEGGWV